MGERSGAGGRRFVVLCLALAVVCGTVALRYFGRAFPEASIQFNVNRSESGQVASGFLSSLGLETAGRKHAATFDYDEDTKTFLERRLGLERARQVYGKQVRLWRWSHRWFRPHEKEELRVEVTPGGEIAGFEDMLPEEEPGAALEPDSARTLAERFLTERMHLSLADYDFLETSSTHQPHRVDHTFTWKKRGLDLGDPDASYRVSVTVAGDRATSFAEFLDIPQAWQDGYARLRARNETASLVATLFLLLTWIAMLGSIVFRIRDRDVKWRTVVGFGSVACVLQLLAALNGFDLEKFGYETQDSYASFVTRFLLQAVLGSLAYGGGIALLAAAAEPIYRERYPDKMSLSGYFTRRGLRTRSFFGEVLLGLVLMLFFAAYQSVFYVLAAKRGAWAPLEVPYDNMLTTAIPWALVLFVGFFPATFEEFTSRMFSVPFFDKLFGRAGVPPRLATAAAIVLASFVWGFAHSNYPNQPFWIRGVEVGSAGVLVSVVMLRYGILATLVWHYTVDAFYTALLMLRSGNSYFVFSGLVTAGIMLVPLVGSLVLYWRNGGFEPETGLRNRDEPAPRPAAAPVRAATPSGAGAYEPVSARRFAIGAAAAAALLLLYLVPAKEPGEGIEMESSRSEAVEAARGHLRALEADPASYHVTTQIVSRYEPSVGRYVLERASLARLNSLYTGLLRTPVWRVRFFKPDEREEYIFNLPVDEVADSAGTQPAVPLWAFEHVIPDSAAGDTLRIDAAQLIASDFLRGQGIEPGELELKESRSERQKARIDHHFEWQVPDTTLGDAGVRYMVIVRGSEVAGLRPYMHLPEAWLRAYEERSVLDWVVWGLSLGILGAVVFLVVVQFVSAVRVRRFPWGPSLLWGGAASLLVLVLAALRWQSDLLARYETELPYKLFLVGVGISVFLLCVLVGLLVTVLVGTVFAVRPQTRAFFSGGCDRRYVRDAILLAIVGIALQLGLRRLGTTITWLGARAAAVEDFPKLDAAARALPWLDVSLAQVLAVLVLLPLFALVVQVASRRLQSVSRLVLLGVVVVILAADGARSFAQFGLQLAMDVSTLAVLGFAVVFLLRSDDLAYVLAFLGARAFAAAAAWFAQPAPGAVVTGLATSVALGGALVVLVLKAGRGRGAEPARMDVAAAGAAAPGP